MTIDDGRRRAQGWEVLFHERTPQSRAAPRLMPSAITGVCDLFSARRPPPVAFDLTMTSKRCYPHKTSLIITRE